MTILQSLSLCDAENDVTKKVFEEILKNDGEVQ